ncbi:MAG: hypothetical protein LH660_01525 [Phormidesmis sp. CAN_BIN36]|nr:hypothetical protein [Phormidesmis sp. CAN_BIN36]
MLLEICGLIQYPVEFQKLANLTHGLEFYFHATPRSDTYLIRRKQGTIVTPS